MQYKIKLHTLAMKGEEKEDKASSNRCLERSSIGIFSIHQKFDGFRRPWRLPYYSTGTYEYVLICLQAELIRAPKPS